jgi:hypothetical protein
MQRLQKLLLGAVQSRVLGVRILHLGGAEYHRRKSNGKVHILDRFQCIGVEIYENFPGVSMMNATRDIRVAKFEIIR